MDIESDIPLLLTAGGGAFFATSGFPGLFLSQKNPLGQRWANAMALAGAGFGLIGALGGLLRGGESIWRQCWGLPGAEIFLGLDGLSAFFLVSVFLLGGLGSLYGLGYWPQREHPENGQKLSFFWGLMVAGMVFLVLARNGILFLFGWEIMALSAFFLITTEDEKAHVRWAGWLYLIAAHVSVLCLFGMFVLMRQITGSFELRPINADEAGLGTLTLIFLLGLTGFGLKAGIMPFHIWLPDAHGNAPSHVSALLSGVVIKMGVYGLLRMTSILPDPPVFWGELLLMLGAISSVLGVVYALGQHDLKRLLAYHSVENIGIIFMGMGLAMIGRGTHREELMAFGIAGCLLHVWNHGLFKGLLFLGAGSVISQTHTHAIDKMGGLAKLMPATALLFLTGAVAICGLPPLNGFISEWLLYLGFFHSIGKTAEPALVSLTFAAPVLAMTGALALACFVKVYGVVFTGLPRSERAAQAKESPATMVGPMAVLASLCLIIGMAPILIVPLLTSACRAWIGWLRPPLAWVGDSPDLVQWKWFSIVGCLLFFLAISGGWILKNKTEAPRRGVGTWDCGYAAPTPRMQYTASSFAETITGMFALVFPRREHRPVFRMASEHRLAPPVPGHLDAPLTSTDQRSSALFPGNSKFDSHSEDPVLDHLVLPFGHAAARMLGWFRRLQQGHVEQYVLYIFLMLLGLILWTIPLKNIVLQWVTR